MNHHMMGPKKGFDSRPWRDKDQTPATEVSSPCTVRKALKHWTKSVFFRFHAAIAGDHGNGRATISSAGTFLSAPASTTWGKVSFVSPVDLKAAMATTLRSAICLCFLVTGARAESFDKPCILAAAEHLPRIPGIEIIASRTKALPADLQAKLDHGLFHTLVEIDAKAAGQDTTFQFFCVAGGKGAPHVQRVN